MSDVNDCLLPFYRLSGVDSFEIHRLMRKKKPVTPFVRILCISTLLSFLLQNSFP